GCALLHELDFAGSPAEVACFHASTNPSSQSASSPCGVTAARDDGFLVCQPPILPASVPSGIMAVFMQVTSVFVSWNDSNDGRNDGPQAVSAPERGILRAFW